MNLYVAIGYLVVLIVVSRLRTRPIKSPTMQALRAFFPSWKFFDELGDVPVLLHRVGQDPSAMGPWQPSLPKLRRRAGSLLVNAEGNLWLAYGSVVQQLVIELDELPEADASGSDAAITERTTYQITRELVAFRIRELEAELPPYYQFKVVTMPVGAGVGAAAAASPAEDLLISPVYQH